MKHIESIAPLFLLLTLSACASRPVYIRDDARALRENGASYWEASAEAPAYLQVRMRRPRGRDSSTRAAEYAGTLSLSSLSPVVIRSTFTLTEGGSASFHYEFNGYSPAAIDVAVECAQGKCRVDSQVLNISPEGMILLKPRKTRTYARAAPAAAAEALQKDKECAILHDSLRSLREQDASIRSFTAKFGEAETRAMARRAERKYAAKNCAAWLDERGGVGAAWRRVRVSQWTSFRGN